MYIRKDDMVEVIAGDDKGTRGKVLARPAATKNKVVVEGVNRVYRHLKPSPPQPAGRPALEGDAGRRLERHARSTRRTNKPTRVGVRYLPDGSKELYAKKSGTGLRLLSKPNPKYATKK